MWFRNIEKHCFCKIMWLMCFKTRGGLVNFMTGNVNTRPIYSSQMHHCHVHNLSHCDISFQKFRLEGGSDSGTEVWQDESGNKWDQMGTRKLAGWGSWNTTLRENRRIGMFQSIVPFSNWEDEHLHYLGIQSDGLGLDSKMWFVLKTWKCGESWAGWLHTQ